MEKLRNEPLHANIHSAMEMWTEGIRKVQARRKEEIVNATNRQRNGGPRHLEEKGTLYVFLCKEYPRLNIKYLFDVCWFFFLILRFFFFKNMHSKLTLTYISFSSFCGRRKPVHTVGVKVLHSNLPTNGKQLPAFPFEVWLGFELRSQRWEARVLPLCHRGPCFFIENG